MVANARKSKKRSAASSPSQPDRLIFFTDANLGRRIVPEALRAAGEEVKVHDDCFAAGTQDLVWLRKVGRNGWIVLTKDSRIRYRRNEMEALLSSGTRSFVLVSRNMPGVEIAKIFVSALPGMKKLCAALPAPFIAHVHHDGKVVLMKTVRKSG
jgi:PIN like domain